jgi:hypothetical protein
MTPINWLAIWFLASVVAAPFIGQWLYRRRTRNEFLAILALNKRLVDRERDARIERLARKLWIADKATELSARHRRAGYPPDIYRTLRDQLDEDARAFALDTPDEAA